MEDLGGNAPVRLGEGQKRNAEQQQGLTEESQGRLAGDTTDLNRKGRKIIRKDHKEKPATDFHRFSGIEILLLPIRVDPRESVAEKLTLFYANPALFKLRPQDCSTYIHLSRRNDDFQGFFRATGRTNRRIRSALPSFL